VRFLCALCVAVFASVTPAVSFAASTSVVGREVDALLARLETSQCQFQRNGRWHDAIRARSHLERKLRYLEERTILTSSEQFIELAASRSSMSGEAYRVRCAGRAEQTSAAWFLEQLKSIRDSHPIRPD